ncbi:MAG TPA: Ig-like domain-containing protein, partial [Planctomycetota bacterium]|nr:Ig-like domain-containing protein [Planctomycetota bacterium]
SLLTTSAYTNTNLVNGTPYYFVVRAQNSSQEESANSLEVAGTPNGTDTTAPSLPVITSSTRKTKDATPATNGTAEPGSTVRVYAGATQIGSTTAAPNGTWTVSNPSALGADGAYVITSRATDAASNQSAPSSSITITLDTTPPAAPTNVRVMATPAFIDIEWTASTSNDVAGYSIYRQTDGGSWTLLNTTGLSLITKYRDSSVSAGHTYNYRITAVDDALAD